MAKQRTKWLWLMTGKSKTFIRVGWIYNKNSGVPEDKIRVQVHGLNYNLDFNLRIDEALSLIAGLSKVMCIQTIERNIKLCDT